MDETDRCLRPGDTQRWEPRGDRGPVKIFPTKRVEMRGPDQHHHFLNRRHTFARVGIRNESKKV